MNSRLKIVASVAALAVIVVAAFALPKGDSNPTSAEQPAVEATMPTTGPTGADREKKSSKRAPANPPLLTAASPKELTFSYGETIRFAARNGTADEVHVHGYDKSMDLPANRTKSMSFKANIEGIFEIELEQSGKPIGTLKVESK